MSENEERPNILDEPENDTRLSTSVLWVVGFFAWGLHVFGVMLCMSMTDISGPMNLNVQFPVGAVLVGVTSIAMWFTRSKQASFTTILYCFAISIYAAYIVIMYPEQPDGRANEFGPPLWCFFAVMGSLVVIMSGVPAKLWRRNSNDDA